MTATTKIPTFHHSEIENLYRYGFNLPPELIQLILELPRASVVADLEAVLRDAISRKEDWATLEFNEQEHNFALHAMFMLGALKSEESLPILLEVHRQQGDWLDFWFGDWLTENMWEPLMWCGVNRLDDLAAFIKTDITGDEYGHSNAVEALTQIALHLPEKHAAVVRILEDLLRFYLNKAQITECSDSGQFIVANLAVAVERMQEASLLPLVEACYEADIVDVMMFGDWEEYKECYQQSKKEPQEVVCLDLVDLYYREHKILEDFELDELELEKEIQQAIEAKRAAGLGNFTPSDKPMVNATKIGRNDPCPCGSGKKYKRCCGLV